MFFNCKYNYFMVSNFWAVFFILKISQLNKTSLDKQKGIAVMQSNKVNL